MIGILSVCHIALFAFYNSLYRHRRRGGDYRVGKDLSFEQLPIKRKITKLAFVANFLLVLVSFWVAIPGAFATSTPLRFAGVLVTLAGVIFLRYSLSYLAENYSPLFDSHKPFRIVREGPYRFVRHPVYLANMIIILGYVIAGASVWSVLLGAWGWFYMAWSLIQEERLLIDAFPEYVEYKRTSRRLIPFVY